MPDGSNVLVSTGQRVVTTGAVESLFSAIDPSGLNPGRKFSDPKTVLSHSLKIQLRFA